MGMRSQNINMKTTVKKADLLAKLEKNLQQHAKIVKEARAGYIEKAKITLMERLEEIKKGRTVSLTFLLTLPQDYSEVYKSAVQMLKWNTAEEVELTADEFRQLVEDKWDWTHGFYASNSPYSETAAYFDGVAATWHEDKEEGWR